MTKAELVAAMVNLPDDTQIFIHVQYIDDIDTIVGEIYVGIIEAEPNDDTGQIDPPFVVIRQNDYNPL